MFFLFLQSIISIYNNAPTLEIDRHTLVSGRVYHEWASKFRFSFIQVNMIHSAQKCFGMWMICHAIRNWNSLTWLKTLYSINRIDLFTFHIGPLGCLLAWVFRCVVVSTINVNILSQLRNSNSKLTSNTRIIIIKQHRLTMLRSSNIRIIWRMKKTKEKRKKKKTNGQRQIWMPVLCMEWKNDIRKMLYDLFCVALVCFALPCLALPCHATNMIIFWKHVDFMGSEYSSIQ